MGIFHVWSLYHCNFECIFNLSVWPVGQFPHRTVCTSSLNASQHPSIFSGLVTLDFFSLVPFCPSLSLLPSLTHMRTRIFCTSVLLAQVVSCAWSSPPLHPTQPSRLLLKPPPRAQAELSNLLSPAIIPVTASVIALSTLSRNHLLHSCPF